MKKNTAIFFIVAFIFRLVSLNQSLWLDEATTAKVISHFSYLDIILKFSPADFHPPLFYLMEKLWTTIFGLSEVSLRMPSVIFSLLAGYVVYLIGKKIKNEKVGIISSVLFLVNPLVMYYSQEARMYMMAVFFCTLILYAFIDINNNKKVSSRSWFIFNLSSGLAFLTFYGTIFFTTTLLLYFLIKKQYRNFFLSLLGPIVSFLIISPLISEQFQHSRQALQYVVNWKLVLGQANIKNLLLIPLKFSIGRISFYPKIVYYSISGIWTLFISALFIRGGVMKKNLAFVFVFPLVLGIVFSFFSPLLQYFRFLYLVPVMCILIAVSMTRYKWLILTTVVGSILFSAAYLFLPQFHREDWKALSAGLSKNAVVYMIPSSSDPVLYYRPDVKIKDIRNITSDSRSSHIVLPYTAAIFGIQLPEYLEQRGMRRTEVKTYRELTIEEWK